MNVKRNEVIIFVQYLTLNQYRSCNSISLQNIDNDYNLNLIIKDL